MHCSIGTGYSKRTPIGPTAPHSSTNALSLQGTLSCITSTFLIKRGHSGITLTCRHSTVTGFVARSSVSIFYRILWPLLRSALQYTIPRIPRNLCMTSMTVCSVEKGISSWLNALIDTTVITLADWYHEVAPTIAVG